MTDLLVASDFASAGIYDLCVYLWKYYSLLQSLKAVTAYFSNKQSLPFGFAWHGTFLWTRVSVYTWGLCIPEVCVRVVLPPCRIRSDRQTTSLTLTTGVCEAGTKMRGASNMNIHYDVTGLLTAAWRSHSGQIVWAAWINCELAREEGGSEHIAHIRVIQVLPVADNWIDEDGFCQLDRCLILPPFFVLPSFTLVMPPPPPSRASAYAVCLFTDSASR